MLESSDLVVWIKGQVSVHHCYRVCQEIEVVAVVSDLFLMFVGVLLARATWRWVRPNHFPVVVVINGRDNKLWAPVRIDKAPRAINIDHAVVVSTVDSATQTISWALHFTFHHTAWNACSAANINTSRNCVCNSTYKKHHMQLGCWELNV